MTSVPEAFLFQESRSHSTKVVMFRRLNGPIAILNLASSVAFGALMYIFRSFNSTDYPHAHGTDFIYYVSRASVRVGDLLHASSRTAATTEGVARHGDILWGSIRTDLMIACTVMFSTVLIYIGVQFCARRFMSSRTLEIASFLAALLIMPGVYVFVCWLAWNWSIETRGGMGFWQSPYWPGLVLSFLAAVFAALLLLKRRSRTSLVSAVLVTIHSGMWFWLIVSALPLSMYLSLRIWWLLPFTFLLAVVVSFGVLYYEQENEQPRIRTSRKRVLLVCAVLVSVSVLAYLWRPSAASALSTQHLTSTSIEYSRGPCFGACPSYSVIIGGDGSVKFNGTHNTRVKGNTTGSVDPKKVAQILNRLNSANFNALEDRAFLWCFDTPTVGVSVTINGEKKTVMSDAACYGKKDGIQGRFVEVAEEIDQIVDTDQWVKCENRYCR